MIQKKMPHTQRVLAGSTYRVPGSKFQARQGDKITVTDPRGNSAELIVQRGSSEGFILGGRRFRFKSFLLQTLQEVKAALEETELEGIDPDDFRVLLEIQQAIVDDEFQVLKEKGFNPRYYEELENLRILRNRFLKVSEEKRKKAIAKKLPHTSHSLRGLAEESYYPKDLKHWLPPGELVQIAAGDKRVEFEVWDWYSRENWTLIVLHRRPEKIPQGWLSDGRVVWVWKGEKRLPFQVTKWNPTMAFLELTLETPNEFSEPPRALHRRTEELRQLLSSWGIKE